MRRPAMLLCVVALAGCGGGDDGGGGGGDRLSKAEFSAQGKKICQEGAAETKKLIQAEAAKPDVQKMPAEKQRIHLATEAMPVMERSLSRIEELEAPEEYQEHVEKLTTGVREVMDLFEEALNADESEAQELAGRLQELQTQTRTAAKAAGLEACLPENT